MYHAHFGLTATPFTSQPVPAHYVPTAGHEEAIARLEFLSDTQSGLGFLVGPPGSGKSLLLGVFARNRRRQGIAAALVSAAQGDLSELQFSIAAQLGVSLPGWQTPSRLMRLLSDRLAELRYDQTSTVLLIDDLDRVGDDHFQQVSELLASLPQTPLLSVVLAASYEAVERLPASLAQRADLRIEVFPWDLDDVRQYLSVRLARCGCASLLFDDGAISVLFEASEGNPRRLGQLANLALVAAAAKDILTIDADTVEEVCRELCVGPG